MNKFPGATSLELEVRPVISTSFGPLTACTRMFLSSFFIFTRSIVDKVLSMLWFLYSNPPCFHCVWDHQRDNRKDHRARRRGTGACAVRSLGTQVHSNCPRADLSRCRGCI